METYKKVFNLFEEILLDLENEYRGNNFEYGEMNVDAKGLTQLQAKKLHEYRMKLQAIQI